MKYKAPHTSKKKLGSRDHTDKNFVTVLCQGIEGLEIQLKDGEWITAKPDSLAVMIGDSLYVSYSFILIFTSLFKERELRNFHL